LINLAENLPDRTLFNLEIMGIRGRKNAGRHLFAINIDPGYQE
jgi:hypothetical protein